MVEGAITLPLMALIALALVNLSLAGYAAVTAANAAEAHPGALVTATVTWQVPNYCGPLLHLFAADSPSETISGEAVSVDSSSPVTTANVAPRRTTSNVEDRIDG